MSKAKAMKQLKKDMSDSTFLEEEGSQLPEPAAKISRTESTCDLLTSFTQTMTPANEDQGMVDLESDHQPSIPSTCKASEVTRKKGPSEPPTVEEFNRRVRKETGMTGFIPLSTGKYLSDMWWEPYDIEILDKPGPVRWLLLSVRLFVNFSDTIDPFDPACNIKFRVGADDVLKIAFLRSRLLKDIHSETKDNPGYDEWLRRACIEFNLGECCSDTEMALKVMKRELSSQLVRLPPNFRLMFQKKSHTEFKDISSYTPMVNRNSILCKAQTPKVEFYYEIRINLFVLGEEMVFRKKEKEKRMDAH